MGRITFTADAHHKDIIEDVEAEDDVESQSAAVRECITRYADLQHRVEELQNEIDDLETELERVRNEKRLILEERDEKNELVRYAETERTRQKKKNTARVSYNGSHTSV